MEQWYYSESGTQRGPVGAAEIRTLLENGKLPSATLVWTDGMTRWLPASSLPGFQLSPYAPPTSETATDIDWSGWEPSGSQQRPWVRYWARTGDLALFCTAIGGIGIVVFPQLEEMGDAILGFILILIYNFIEPLLLATCGTTPFKALLNVRVRKNDGEKPGYVHGLGRTFSLWLRGQGAGIGLIALIAGIIAYRRLSEQGITSWDEIGGFTVSHRTIAWWRWLILVSFFGGFIGLVILGSMEW